MRYQTRLRWLILLPLCALFAGCTGNDTAATQSGPTSTSGQNTSQSSASCREPTATPQDSLPEVFRKTGPDNEWIGEGGLWVEVSWIKTDAADWKVDSGYAFKYATATLADGRLSSRPGQPAIAAQRLHGSGEGAGGFGGYASASGTLPHWWPTVLKLPTDGCWVITEKSGETVVSFQVQLP